MRDDEAADFWQLLAPFPDEEGLLALCGAGADVLPAGARSKYSNVAYSLLGLVVARVSGEPHNSYVAREVVGRLGLTRTGPELDPPGRASTPPATPALSYADVRLPVDHVDTRAMSSATGFHDTAEDVCGYAAAHFAGDTRLLSRDVQRRMQHRQWDVSDTDGSYALGLMGQRVGERRLLGHSGGHPGHITRTLFDQAARLAVSVFTNAIDGPAAELTTGAVRILDLAAGAESDSDAATRSRFCGRFAGLWGVLDDADLGGRLFALDPIEAEPAAPGYDAPGETMVFTFDGDAVESVRGNGGTTRWPLEAYAATIAGRDRVTAPDVR